MIPEFFEMLRERLAPRVTKQTTNWKEPLNVGLKITTTLRYLATGETYTSLQFSTLPVQKWEGQHLQVCGPSLQGHRLGVPG